MLTIPHIWVPGRRQIEMPPLRQRWARPRHPRPWHRPTCPLFAMAAGPGALDSSGNGVLSAAGIGYLDCCCALYVQARFCSDHTGADKWFQYRVSGGTPQLYDVSTSSWVNLSFYFQISLSVYYVDSSCTVNATPGTLASSYTVRTGCYTCTGCTGSFPAEFLVVFAGVSPCTCVLFGDAVYRSLTADPNGSYVTQAGSSCNSFKSLPASNMLTHWDDGTCSSGTAVGDAIVSLNTASGVVSFNILNTGFFGEFLSIFYGTFTPTTCARTVTVSNLLTTCNTTVGGSNLAIGTGGTATITPL